MNAAAEISSISSDVRCVPETDDCAATLYIKSRETVKTINDLVGPFYLSKANNQVFDCGGNVLRRSHQANIFEEDGSRKVIQHDGGIVDCGITKDSMYYWLAYERATEGKWYSEFFLFNKLGKAIYNTTSKFDSTVQFKYNGKKYSVYIPPIP